MNKDKHEAKEVNILPCPFCGSKNIFDGTKGMNTAHKRVVCLECNAQTSGIMSWNRRSPSITNSIETESLKARVKELEQRLIKAEQIMKTWEEYVASCDFEPIRQNLNEMVRSYYSIYGDIMKKDNEK